MESWHGEQAVHVAQVIGVPHTHARGVEAVGEQRRHELFTRDALPG
jgi:hypothetical protein